MKQNPFIGWYNTSEENKKKQQDRVLKSKRKKVKLIREAKDRKCADCQQWYPHYVMQFDHVRGKKLFSICYGASHGWSALKAEIEKCEVVCANCHAERTYTRVNKNFLNIL